MLLIKEHLLSVRLAYERLTRLSFPRRFPIAQFPNPPLIVAVLAGEAGKLLDGGAHSYSAPAGPAPPILKGDKTMVILGVDAHKRSHTVVAVDEAGRKLGQRTAGTTSDDHLTLLAWAQDLGGDRQWAVEDCHQRSRRLERGLLGAGEQIVRVPPKMMAHARDAARTHGKSDPIDALAVARAALREPGLPSRATAMAWSG